MVRFLSLCLGGALLVLGCGVFTAGKTLGKDAGETARETVDKAVGESVDETAGTTADRGDAGGEGPVSAVDREGAYREQAARMASSLDDFYLASQVLMTGLDNRTGLSGAVKSLLGDYPPGGIMFFKYNLNTDKEGVRSFLGECSALVTAAIPEGIAPFLAVDHEGGLVHRFGPGVERLPEPASFWELARDEGWETALEAIESSARRSGREIRDLGITMNFAPVAEILSGDNRLFLETRSYGPDGAFVEAAAAAFIRGMDAAGVACVVKHFPGNSGEDPHRGGAVLGADRETLDRMVRPFAALISGLSPPALMVSHIVVPAWDRERNASLSPEIIRGRLRGELGFTGIVLGDDYAMGAIAAAGLGPEDAVVAALNAGVDMVMTWPGNIRAIHGAILGALGDGRLKRERLREAVERILAEKIRYGLWP